MRGTDVIALLQGRRKIQNLCIFIGEDPSSALRYILDCKRETNSQQELICFQRFHVLRNPTPDRTGFRCFRLFGFDNDGVTVDSELVAGLAAAFLQTVLTVALGPTSRFGSPWRT